MFVTIWSYVHIFEHNFYKLKDNPCLKDKEKGKDATMDLATEHLKEEGLVDKC